MIFHSLSTLFFNYDNLEKVTSSIKEAIKYLDDEAMIELSLQVMQKLNDMSDEQFEELVFVATE